MGYLMFDYRLNMNLLWSSSVENRVSHNRPGFESQYKKGLEEC